MSFPGFTEFGGNLVQPNQINLAEDALIQCDTLLSQGQDLTYSCSQIPPTIGILSAEGQSILDNLGTNSLGTAGYNFAETSPWDLRYVSFGGWIGGTGTKHALVGWTDNSTQPGREGTLKGGEFRLSYGTDGYIRLYYQDVLKLTSASTFTGDQTLTLVGFDDQQQANVYVPSNWTIAPIIALTADVASLKAGETASLTFTLSESSSNFTAEDIAISGGSLSDFSGSGSSYSAIFTPDIDFNADGLISVNSSAFSDLAGNTNTDGADSDNSLTLSIDTLAPSIALSSDITSLSTGDVANLSFSLSEPSTDFDASDISISGGSLSAFSGSSSSYTAIFTPTADIATDALISVANSKFTDISGNFNVDGADPNNSLSLSVDTVVSPTIILTSDITTLSRGDVATLSFSLSEPSTDFTLSDITFSGGSLSNFSGSSTSYTATFTPNANSTSDGLISVASSAFSDLAGNPNIDGADPDNSLTLSIDTTTADTTPPTIALSSDITSLSTGDVANLSFSLSEPSTDFTASDISISGGSLSAFSGSGSSYTAIFTPAADSTTDGLISVISSSFCDSFGRNRTTPTSLMHCCRFFFLCVAQPRNLLRRLSMFCRMLEFTCAL